MLSHKIALQPVLKIIPDSINYHITNRCNFKCKFCFAKYHDCTQILSKSDSINLIKTLADNGCQKLNFAGGEPTLVPYLSELVNVAKDQNLFVSLISNGTGINQKFIDICRDSLDLIGLSIDSQYNVIERQLDRTFIKNKTAKDYDHIKSISATAQLIHDSRIPLKINTTLTKLTYQEDMREFIQKLNPFRWKVFQVHHIRGINDPFFREGLGIDEKEFLKFIKFHQNLTPIYETSNMILDSYCMITPDGRFYQDSNRVHHYSQSILQIGIKNAFQQINYVQGKYLDRKGDFFINKINQNSLRDT